MLKDYDRIRDRLLKARSACQEAAHGAIDQALRELEWEGEVSPETVALVRESCSEHRYYEGAELRRFAEDFEWKV